MAREHISRISRACVLAGQVSETEGLQPIKEEPQWYKEALYVFEGQFTVDEDKEKLVSVVLGLCASCPVAK